MDQVTSDIVIKMQGYTVREYTGRSGRRTTKHISNTRRGCHDGIVSSILLLLVDLIETMPNLMTSTAHEGPGHIMLLLICCCAEVSRLRRGIAVIAETGDTFTWNANRIVHHPPPHPQG